MNHWSVPFAFDPISLSVMIPMLCLFVAVRLPFLLAGYRSVTVSRWISLYEFGWHWTMKLLKLLIYNVNYKTIGFGWMLLDAEFIDYEPRGSGFNSCQPHQKVKPVTFNKLRAFSFAGTF